MTLGVGTKGTVRLWFKDATGLWKAQPRDGCLKWGVVTKMETTQPMAWYLTIRPKKNMKKVTNECELTDYLDNMSVSTTY